MSPYPPPYPPPGCPLILLRDLKQIEKGEAGTVEDLSSAIADSLNVASGLSPEDGNQIVALTAKKMGDAKPDSVGRVRSMLTDLQERLDNESREAVVAVQREAVAR